MAAPDYVTVATRDRGQNVVGAGGQTARFDYVNGRLTQVGEGPRGPGFAVGAYDATYNYPSGGKYSVSGTSQEGRQMVLGDLQQKQNLYNNLPAEYSPKPIRTGPEINASNLPGYSTVEGEVVFVPIASDPLNMTPVPFRPNFTSATQGPVEVRYTTTVQQAQTKPLMNTRAEVENARLNPYSTDSKFGIGATEAVLKNAPERQAYGFGGQQSANFANIGRMAIVSGAGLVDFLAETGKNPASAAYAFTAGNIAAYKTTKGLAGDVAAGRATAASSKVLELGIPLVAFEGFSRFGGGVVRAVGESYATRGMLAAVPKDFEGFARGPIVRAQGQAIAESFRTAPPFSMFQERAAYEQGRVLDIKLSPGLGPVTANRFLSEQGMQLMVYPEQFKGMYQPARLGPVRAQTGIGETGLTYLVGKRDFEGMFTPSEFSETTLATPHGIFPAVEKTIFVEQKPMVASSTGSPMTPLKFDRPASSPASRVELVETSPAPEVKFESPKPKVVKAEVAKTEVKVLEGGGNVGQQVQVQKPQVPVYDVRLYDTPQPVSGVQRGYSLTGFQNTNREFNAVSSITSLRSGEGVVSRQSVPSISVSLSRTQTATQTVQRTRQMERQVENEINLEPPGVKSVLGVGFLTVTPTLNPYQERTVEKQEQKMVGIQIPKTPERTEAITRELPPSRQKPGAGLEKKRKKLIIALQNAGKQKRPVFTPEIDLGSRTVAGFRYGPKAARGQLSPAARRAEYYRTGGLAVRTPAEIKEANTRRLPKVSLGFRR